MTEERARRKLSGILSADAVGYSRLMEEDEASTIRNLEGSKRLMSEFIQQFKGRVVDAPGDNLLAEFGSVVDATECAVKIQRELKAINAELPDNRKMQFRIGVNLGDVVEEADRIYGDGVNIAARLEGLAEPAGICISRTAYDHVKNKLELGYEYLGEYNVKNITEPVRVYRVLMEPEAAGKVIGEKRFLGRISRRVALSAIIILVIVAGGLIGWNIYLQQSRKVEPASIEKMAFPLPDKPSIAVLPFTNMSGNPEQEYFSDGITEDLITDLSQISGLFVISRNSAFTYKGKPVKTRQVAEDLGVRYVLEGSVRKADNRVRINAQLIDATTGGHLWAKRYDSRMDDVFDLQDKITQKIVTALALKLTVGEQKQVTLKETDNIAAYDAFLKGWGHYQRRTPKDWAKAVSYFKKAIEFDPNYSRAHAALASLYYWSYRYWWFSSLGIKDHTEAYKLTSHYTQMAMKNPTSRAYWNASQMSLRYHQYEQAIAEVERAIALDPNDPDILIQMARVLIFAGRPGEALGFIKNAMRLDPHYPAEYQFIHGLAYLAMGQLEEAVTLLESAVRRNPDVPLWGVALAVTYAHLGRNQEAHAMYNIIGYHHFSNGFARWLWPFKDPEVADRFTDGLRKARMK